MSKKLIIVESPTKIKTLKKFFGDKDYIFESSVGHIRDLPASKFGIDIDNGFEPAYENLEGKEKVIKSLIASAKKASMVYLSPDPDREGEAIAWHIANLLPKGTPVKRVSFNAITKQAVEEALSKPRDIDMDLVNAQQARRLLDRMVGYKISPILHRRILKGGDGFLSAGRVQSVALKFVVDREKEIEAFVPVEYWNIYATFEKGKDAIKASLFSIDGKKIVKEHPKEKTETTLPNEKKALEAASLANQGAFQVNEVIKKEKRRNPVAPFITSTLQQEASRHYGFNASRTMSIAQSLYEGVELKGKETEGLITYMRTDSVRVETEAINGVRDYIRKKFGKEYRPEKPVLYKTKKSAQDAHEAIRPTSLMREPEQIKKSLTSDQYKLYSLIYKRFVASQMKPAVYDTVTMDIASDNGLIFRASGSIIKFPGFLAAYEEKVDNQEDHQDSDTILPDLPESTPLKIKGTDPVQSFTRPPGRYTEASLVKDLEKSGIGRPSTYATIMNKIHSKDYTTKEKSALKPTELGKIICQMLETNFAAIMDTSFTAEMENELDQIAEGDIDWKSFLSSFWTHFSPLVDEAEKNAHVPKIPTDRTCPKCGAHLEKIWARGKYFYGCSAYPDCDYTAPLEELDLDKSEYQDGFDWDQPCPKCGSEMKLRSGKFGIFLGCSKYPKCNGIVNIPKKDEELKEDLPRCPAFGCPGKLIARRSRYGKVFYACSTYPKCDVIGNAVDDVIEKYTGRKRTAVEKKTAAKGKKGKGGKRTAPEKTVSKELQAIIGVDSASRPDATKKLWEYIKKHDLQEPENRRLIKPDKALAKVFGSNDSVDMMKLAGILSNHLS